MGFTKWQKFIHTTASHYVNTTIECGGVCNSHFDDCDLFVYHKDVERCHVGKFEIESGYLDGYSGNFPIHLSMGIILMLNSPASNRSLICNKTLLFSSDFNAASPSFIKFR